MDSDFTQHYEDTLKQANKTLGLIFKIARDFNDAICIKALYCALVRPILEYGAIITCPYSDMWKQRLDSVQNKIYSIRATMLTVARS